MTILTCRNPCGLSGRLCANVRIRDFIRGVAVPRTAPKTSKTMGLRLHPWRWQASEYLESFRWCASSIVVPGGAWCAVSGDEGAIGFTTVTSIANGVGEVVPWTTKSMILCPLVPGMGTSGCTIHPACCARRPSVYFSVVWHRPIKPEDEQLTACVPRPSAVAPQAGHTYSLVRIGIPTVHLSAHRIGSQVAVVGTRSC